MLFHRASIAAVALFIFSLASLVAAQCGELYDNSKNGCTFDFTNPNAIFGLYEETFPRDWMTAVGVCPPSTGFTAVCDFYFVDQADQVTATATYSIDSSQPSTDVFPFPDVPATSLVPGAPVTCSVFAGIPGVPGFDYIETFTIAPSISITPIPPIISTTTVTVPTVAVTTTTSTSTLVQPSATTITPATVVATTATGTKTVLAKTLALTTKTITITQPVRTSQKVTIVTTTTTLSCLGAPKHKRASPGRAQVLAQHNPVFARQDATTTQTPTCNQPAPATPTITATIFSTVTSTSTETDLAFTTSTSVSTVTLPTPTSYRSVQATTTRTLTFTLYKWTTLPLSVVTQTKTFTNTRTVLPKTPITACGGRPATTTTAASPGTCSVYSTNGCRVQHCTTK